MSNLCEFWGENEPDIENRRCMKCLETKTLTEFEIRSYGANGHLEYRNDCRLCRKKEHKQRTQLEKIYGHLRPIDGDSYRCPICDRNVNEITMNGIRYTQTRKIKNHSVWTLDHKHDTGEFRGFICNDCNVGLGRFFGDPIALRNAANYIEG